MSNVRIVAVVCLSTAIGCGSAGGNLPKTVPASGVVTLDGKLIVEVDGATHSTGVELARDAERTRVLTSLGFQIVRVSNTDVYENIEGVQETIALELNAL